ncbi:MAG: hypothetical protein DI528_12835 [Shinella sp.]|nr:MAG: hypothetical protein DI528_12835 [Shinella sp.]
MALIQCLLGTRETTVGSTTYKFSPDENGRCVARVISRRHIHCLISAGTYAEVSETGEDMDMRGTPAPAESAIVPFLNDQRHQHGRRGRR